MTLMRNRTNFGSGWKVTRNEAKDKDWIKIEQNKKWRRITLSREETQYKFVSIEPL
jgi:hypothetical protein